MMFTMETSQCKMLYITVILSIIVMSYKQGCYGQYIINTSGNKQLEALLLRIMKGKQSLSNLQSAISTSTGDRKNQVEYGSNDYMLNKVDPNDDETDDYSRSQETVYSGEYDHTYPTSGGNMGHNKRDDLKEAVVDVLVIVDNSIYKNYLTKHSYSQRKALKSIRRYYTLLINLIDSRFKDISGINIPMRIRPVSIKIIEDKNDFNWNNKDFRSWTDEFGERKIVLEPHRALEDLQVWLVDHNSDLPVYDHAMVFTEYTLVKEKHNFASSGMAYISTICQTDYGYSSSIINEGGGFANVETASHELGHSLGATHDGREGSLACSDDLGYIMAPSVSLRKNYEHNYFTFSPCSVEAFNEMLSSDQGSCLFNSKPSLPVQNKLPGQWLTPEKQCKHVFGATSGECRMSSIEREEICQMLWCKDPDDRYSCITKSGLHAVYGTTCSKDKICYNGKCLDEESVYEANEYRANSKESSKQDRKSLEEKQDKSSENNHRNHNKETKLISVIDKSGEQILLKPGEDENARVRGVINAYDSLKGDNPTLGEKTYLSRKVNIPTSIKEKQSWKHHKTINKTRRPSTTTTTTTTRPTTSRTTSCTRDKNSAYCRRLVYTSGQQACQEAHIATYCCFSCSFYGR